jgi:hypothetical protein
LLFGALGVILAFTTAPTAAVQSTAATGPGRRPPEGNCGDIGFPCAWNTGLADAYAAPVRRGGIGVIYVTPKADDVTISWEAPYASIPGTPLPGSCQPGQTICRFRLSDGFSAVRWSPIRQQWQSVQAPGWLAGGAKACALIGCASAHDWMPVVKGYGISGTARDAGGSPLRGVNIVVSKPGGRRVLETDEAGFYLAVINTRDVYKVTAPRGFCAKGVAPCTRTRTVRPNAGQIDFRRRS